MCALTTVPVGILPPERFDDVVLARQRREIDEAAAHARDVLGDHIVWSINSTATGGGVAEMLHSLLAYARGAGVDARWLVIQGDDEFFRLTKRLHHHLHGSHGDGGPLGDAEREVFDRVTRRNVAELRSVVRPGDIVLVHDPQPAGLVKPLLDHGAHVVWRSHIGIDLHNDAVAEAWDFLLPYVRPAEALVFTRGEYVPGPLRDRPHIIIPPSIDAFSTKNQELAPADVRAILATTGIVESHGHGSPQYVRRDGTLATVSMVASIDRDGPLRSTDPVVLQVSRWDPLKDPVGVLQGFAQGVAGATDAHLVLAGPDPAEVTDDPEGARVYGDCVVARRALPEDVRRRVHLVNLSMRDAEENGAVVNALQRHAHVVVQKSLAEGFGLTVAEAMWKARPVVATNVGGIRDQIEDGVSGLLLDDGHDLEGFAERVRRLLLDRHEARLMGERGQRRIRAYFLGGRHLVQYLNLFRDLLADDAR
ncbi:MAG TPA: glycosyltransferase [Solirubrobacteraceae bacterium]|nr:glycosyltransferase [Solirubrobacteraceae bacterium]HSD79935.1 glycosyltransferase [Solirubrobacteraceae bacterium]